MVQYSSLAASLAISQQQDLKESSLTLAIIAHHQAYQVARWLISGSNFRLRAPITVKERLQVQCCALPRPQRPVNPLAARAVLMMFRFRRYRVFLFVAVLSVLTVYHLTRAGNWETAANLSVEGLKNLGYKDESAASAQDTIPESSIVDSAPVDVQVVEETKATSSAVLDDALTLSTSTLEDVQSTPTPPSSSKLEEYIDPDTEPAIPVEEIEEKFGQHGLGRLEAKPVKSDLPQPHWTKQPEHFPVPSASLIPLPTGATKSIPRIQKVFKAESTAQKTDRERKLATVKDAFTHAWAGYTEHALPHDELKPVSGGFKDPFNGWGATLVDTLDTLWIMGLKEEFESAVEAVQNITFTTSPRKDIPLFETTIRYLGGLVSAYDISDKNYPVLLEKAQELAEVLMGAFDTPNRMPMTYYNWAPSYASQPHRAGTRVVMAELGSLSVEFTRLAQLTQEDKYYDAIARITNEFEKWQDNTKVPGLWPVHLDASGCKKPERNIAQSSQSAQEPLLDAPSKDGSIVLTRSAKSRSANGLSKKDVEGRIEGLASDLGAVLEKRQVDDSDVELTDSTANSASESKTVEGVKSEHSKLTDEAEAEDEGDDFEDVDCEPQGLASPPYQETDTFTIGAMTDSTYEYLPKEYMLLGGQVDQYRTMYKSAMDAVRKYLLYRPMVPDSRDILFAGKYITPGELDLEDAVEDESDRQEPAEPRFDYEGAHLTCFAGGMFAVGAKVFGIESDLNIARRLTDGCIWAYEITETGIMPESFNLVPCESTKSCTWNEEAWWDVLDPNAKERTQRIIKWNEKQRALAEKIAAEEAAAAVEEKTDESPAETTADEVSSSNPEDDDTSNGSGLAKRQVVKSTIKQEDETTVAASHGDSTTETSDTSSEHPGLVKSSIRYESDEEDTVDAREQPSKVKSDSSEGDDDSVTQVLKSIFTPVPIVSHEDFAKARAKEQRLPPGFSGIHSRKYILR